MTGCCFLHGASRGWPALAAASTAAYAGGDPAVADAAVADAVATLEAPKWIVSYDDVRPIHDLYSESEWLQYSIGYSAREAGRGREAMFFSSDLRVPEVTGSMIEIGRSAGDISLRPAA